jgi:photosynthetic reaction center cytochrome c subunit
MRPASTPSVRSFCVLVFVVAVCVVGAGLKLTAQDVAQKPATPEVKTAEQQFKNIQILKGIPADQLIPSMQFISASLGVDCEYCHVERANEKDDKKEKQTARKMIAMTFAINHDHFEGHREVTCMSCHRGTPRPVAIPAVSTGEPEEEAPAAKPADLPAAATVLDKYMKALGGAAAIAKVSSRVQKGKLSGFGPEPVPVDVSTKAPDKRITVAHNQRGDNITAYDGHGGWLGNSGRPPRDMSPAESDAVRLDAALLLGSDPRTLFKEFKPAPPDKIDGKDAVHLLAMNEGKPPAELWFDAGTGLLVRLMRYTETPLGRNPTQIDYADYRDADGLKIPFRWTLGRPSGSFTIQLDESHQNVPVDDKVFQKPAAAQPS